MSDAREVIRTWLQRHDYPSDPKWQTANLLCDLRAAFGADVTQPQAEYQIRKDGHGTWVQVTFGGEPRAEGWLTQQPPDDVCEYCDRPAS